MEKTPSHGRTEVDDGLETVNDKAQSGTVSGLAQPGARCCKGKSLFTDET